ncbi:MAG: diguanylate cyclase (GGDEF)-like protein [Planctomycetota bacterium]|jgi:diguanylate cyclase (GGDEF)-like protein
MDGRKLGTLCIIDTKPRTFSEEELESLKDLAELAEHELAAVQLATMDELTGISNRRGFIALAQNFLGICLRQDIPAALIFLDLNQFKPINDSFGHAEGDKALIAFAKLMKNTFRDSDVFARIGGDEFVVLLTDTSREAVEEIIERYGHSLETYNKKADCGYDISFSYGLVIVDHKQHHSIETLLSQADCLMYEKKRLRISDESRNRVDNNHETMKLSKIERVSSA